jgi:modulator of FtsH protease HflK
MKADFVSYKRATDRCLLGLGIQLLLGLSLLIYAYRAGDHAAMTAAFFVLLGIPVWLTLAIVYDQHRRERVEAMEAESLAASSSLSSSVFEEGAADLRLAAKRLKAMHRFFVPAVSLAIGAALVGIGWWRYGTVREFSMPALGRGWPIALGVAMAVIGFVFARYISGMAKQSVWANLRGGAAYGAGTSLLGLAMVVGQFVDLAGPDSILRWLRVIFPLVMIALGVEVFLNFVLDIYRPRKAGDIPRPAFDSRVLGFVAAPDRVAESISGAIDYQLGYNVTGSWFYRLISRFIGPLVALGIVLLWAMTSMVVVQPHQRGLILRFGRIVNRDVGPGLHFKLPWPIDRVEIPVYSMTDPTTKVVTTTGTATGIRTINAGTNPPTASVTGEPILWTTQHTAEEVFTIVQPSTTARGADGEGAETDLALVAIEVPVHYAVRDVEAYEMLASPVQREVLLRTTAQRAAMQYIATLSVDEVLDKNRSVIGGEIRKRIEQAFIDLNPKHDGKPVVEVLFVGATGAHPPSEVAVQFEQVVEAQQKYHSRLDEARAQASQTLIGIVGDEQLAGTIAAEIDARNTMNDNLLRAPEAEQEPLRQAIAEQELKIQRLMEQAGGSAAAQVYTASADRWVSSMSARGDAQAYRGKLELDKASSHIYRHDQFFLALRDAMAGARLYITSDDVPVAFKIDLMDKQTGLDALVNIGDQGGGQQ